jgi:hypothetical protein
VADIRGVTVIIQDLFQTREAMYVEFNIEERSRNHFFRGNSISIMHSECVLAALVDQHSVLMWPITLSP